MENKSAIIQVMMPFLTKFVWPIFIVIALLFFNAETKEIYSLLKSRVASGAAVKIGFLELGEQASAIEINKLTLTNLPIEAIGGQAASVSKESAHELNKIRQELSKSPGKTIDALKIKSGKIFSPAVLQDYISSLGIKFVVFEQNGLFDGWADSGVFLSQLRLLVTKKRLESPGMNPADIIFPYSELRRKIAGISKESAAYTDSAKQVLEKMQKNHTENLPILNKDKFAFFANRGEILSMLISSLILEGPTSN